MLQEMRQDELMAVDGGLVITTGALIAMGLTAIGVGIGVAWALCD